MRVAVTGASGFIGSALVPELRARGHDVLCLGRVEITEQGFNGREAVVHLANIAHTRVAPALLNEVNVEGTRRAAQAAARAGVRRFIYISSAKAAALRRDAYGESKLAAERALAGVPLETVVLRPPLTYGAGVKANFLALLRAIERGWPLPFASISNRRSLLYVGNLCDAIARCMEAPQAAGRTYSLSDGAPVSTPDLCRALGRSLKKPARLFAFPPALLPSESLTGSLVVDDGAIRRELSWRPPFSFAQGLKATADWYLRR